MFNFVVSINSTQNRCCSRQAVYLPTLQGSCHGSGGKGAEVPLFLLQQGIGCVTREKYAGWLVGGHRLWIVCDKGISIMADCT